MDPNADYSDDSESRDSTDSTYEDADTMAPPGFPCKCAFDHERTRIEHLRRVYFESPVLPLEGLWPCVVCHQAHRTAYHLAIHYRGYHSLLRPESLSADADDIVVCERFARAIRWTCWVCLDTFDNAVQAEDHFQLIHQNVQEKAAATATQLAPAKNHIAARGFVDIPTLPTGHLICSVCHSTFVRLLDLADHYQEKHHDGILHDYMKHHEACQPDLAAKVAKVILFYAKGKFPRTFESSTCPISIAILLQAPRHGRNYCNVCHGAFDEPHHVAQHYVTMHGDATLHRLNNREPTLTMSRLHPCLCYVCFRSFFRLLDLADHYEDFHNDDSLRIYLERSGRLGPCFCHLCLRSFAQPHALSDHLFDVHLLPRSQLRYSNPCPNCHKAFIHPDGGAHLCIPKNPHQPGTLIANQLLLPSEDNHEQPGYRYYCSVCDQYFADRGALADHDCDHQHIKFTILPHREFVLRQHNGGQELKQVKQATCIYVYHCHVCRRDFALPDALIVHHCDKRKVTVIKPSQCQRAANRPRGDTTCRVCYEVFKWPDFLVMHYQHTHSEDDLKQPLKYDVAACNVLARSLQSGSRFQCGNQDCIETFLRPIDLAEHQRAVHSDSTLDNLFSQSCDGNPVGRYRCDGCKLDFSHPWFLVIHNQIIHPEPLAFFEAISPAPPRMFIVNGNWTEDYFDFKWEPMRRSRIVTLFVMVVADAYFLCRMCHQVIELEKMHRHYRHDHEMACNTCGQVFNETATMWIHVESHYLSVPKEGRCKWPECNNLMHRRDAHLLKQIWTRFRMPHRGMRGMGGARRL
ncbi:hypothetical protein F4821DRAFT_262915 [Hypoxylon rubiginosum]|uniref:Uncharacterized protein n=1 Tax=Hypoxylon rubiginosum TaxID=110542 RepID=A0ACC0CSW0_9PEZI|nr:hypothetical protein F4821DRAFT_262915 [Hypoxylon rubiginosum]